MSSQCMFDASLQIERDLGLNQWEADCPTVDGIGLAVPHPEQPGHKLIDWAARLDHSAQAVDQRIKMPAWMERFEARGGRLLIQAGGVGELELLAASHDLVLLAAGKGDVVKLFERDAQRSQFDRPQRALALTYVAGMRPAPDYSRVAFNLIPGGSPAARWIAGATSSRRRRTWRRAWISCAPTCLGRPTAARQ
ncbi:hypothetical protein G6F57_018952 [Rhizopus arrhizus]|nr:hypothetical protein G6F57_018952 [Rhizopus arrhizus]